MKFFETIGRIISGQPIFIDPETIKSKKHKTEAESTHPQSTEHVKPKTLDEKGHKIIPNVYIKHCLPTLDSDELIVWAYIRNDSDYRVKVHKIEIVGQVHPLEHFLEPHDEVNLLVYDGKRLNSDTAHEAMLYYELLDTNDYFCASHNIKYKRELDGTYTIVELTIIHPVRDI